MPWDSEWNEDVADEPFRPDLDPWTDPRDPFYESDAPHAPEQPYYDAFRIEDLVRSGIIQRDGYGPGDMIVVTHQGPDGDSFSVRVRLPRDWRRHDAWSDFYADLRDFFYPLWEEDTGDERTSSGYATAG